MDSKILVGIFILLIALAGCVTNPIETQNGKIIGHISIGPICPVETNPPQPQCQPTIETYKAFPLTLFRNDGYPVKVATIIGDSNGYYELVLEPGKYVIQHEGTSGIGGMQPASFTVEKGKTLTLDLSIDTGIR